MQPRSRGASDTLDRARTPGSYARRASRRSAKLESPPTSYPPTVPADNQKEGRTAARPRCWTRSSDGDDDETTGDRIICRVPRDCFGVARGHDLPWLAEGVLPARPQDRTR